MSCDPKVEYFIEREDSSPLEIKPMPDQGKTYLIKNKGFENALSIRGKKIKNKT